MSEPVRFSCEDGVALITIDNPPLNVTSHAVRAGLMAALDQAEGCGAHRVVLTGAGRCFVAGADAREFDAPPRAPHLPDIVNRIELCALPVIAAINGAALGGGVELALACAARVAAPSASLGLPVVTLGVVPGAGGTQRLPRLIGLPAALDLIAQGRVIKAQEAQALGLIDALEEDPLGTARKMALPARPATGAMPAPAPDDEALAAARRGAEKRMAGQDAPFRAIALIEAATQLPLSAGLARERETFLALRGSDQAAALRHVFFAERRAMAQGRASSEGGGADAVEISSAVVVGGGTMGTAIAYALARIGVAVALVEADPQGAERARGAINRLYEEAVTRGKLSREAAQSHQQTLHSYHVGYGALPPAHLAIEAVFEDLRVKRGVFAALEAALPPEAVLASNTSYLDVNRIAEGLRHPERFIGLHFFSPAHVMKLLEVIKGEHTSAQTAQTALRLAARLGKIPVLAGVCDGFIGNRILTRYRQTCDIMLIEGALPSQVDAAMRGFGMAMGPYEVQDLSGLDIAYANRRRLGWRTLESNRYIPIADRIVEETGRLGRKSAAGWYDYEAGKARPSALIEQIIREESQRAGITRRAFSDAQIVAQATAAMVEEGCRILQEGIAERAADIDLVMVHGYGFPRWRGGPMHWAERAGLAQILRQIAGYSALDPKSWGVPSLLTRAVASGKSFEQL
ncbi:MAG: 3-hydroxyacyl-CoA dehydrogenase NAD-binding domain-containing protein [Neomegalonema sp.]|nr:3-hydroxyacyl-CoA dehydrogenase NAD-binding domain-containing protein [Neomegalonema sp.]